MWLLVFLPTIEGVEMIISPFSEENNSRFPLMTQPYFDDHLVRREHSLQLHLKQLAPPLLEGGRAILWFCHLCQKPWYEVGRRASFVCLSAFQLTEIAQQLGVKVRNLSSLPRSICPLCASLHLGDIPTIEEYLDAQGYRFSWQARTRRHTRLFCQIFRWNLRSIPEALLEGDSAPCDVPTAPKAQVRNVLTWLKTLAEPGKEQTVVLTENDMKRMNSLHPPSPGFIWCGYGWKDSYPVLGQVLLTLGMTFPDSSICSPGLLVACWRQIAREIERTLVC
jgi:hypothetical protein